MGKCMRCGRKGLFLKVTNGLCDNCASTVRMEEEQAEIKRQVDEMTATLADLNALYNKISEDARKEGTEKAAFENAALSTQNLKLQEQILQEKKEFAEISEKDAKLQKSVSNAEQKIRRCKELVKAIQNISEASPAGSSDAKLNEAIKEADALMSPTVTLPLQCLDMKDLRKRYRENEKNIQATFDKYKDRYTTKANIAIYRLMVIALSAELQNVLYNINFGKLDNALEDIKAVTQKYYTIAADGSQSIAPTVKRFIGELDYFFQEAVRIEYEYYVQKERAKEEQRAIREQMRQEAEERKELERQRKQIEKEESKYHDQISQLSQQLEQSDDDEKTRLLKERIEELQRQLGAVAEQREKIINLQNGKAGNVYVISNIGSFGENVFKIGMTRRLEPMDRVNELGSASVPFPVRCAFHDFLR